MSNSYVNTVNRTFKVIADILNSKPTDWNPSGLGGEPADQFAEVFDRTYSEAQVEQVCLPMTVQKAPSSMGVRLYFRIADAGPMAPVAELSSQVVRDWASRT